MTPQEQIAITSGLTQSVASNIFMAQRSNAAQRDLSLREKAYERDDELHKAENALATLTTQRQIDDFKTRERLAPAMINFNTSMETAHAAYHKSYDPSVYENIQIPNEILESNNPELISAAQQHKRQAYQMAVENSLNVTEDGAITELAKGVNGLTRANPSMGLLASNRLRAVLAKREERKRDTGKAFFDDSDVEILNDISGMIDQQNTASSQRELAPKIIPAQYQAQDRATYNESAATKEAINSANVNEDVIINTETKNLEGLSRSKSERFKELNDVATTETRKKQIQGQIKDIDTQISESKEILNTAVRAKEKNLMAGAQAYATIAGKSQQNIQGISQGYFSGIQKVEASKNIKAKRYPKAQEENIKALVTSGKYTKQQAIEGMERNGVVPSQDLAKFLSK